MTYNFGDGGLLMNRSKMYRSYLSDSNVGTPRSNRSNVSMNTKMLNYNNKNTIKNGNENKHNTSKLKDTINIVDQSEKRIKNTTVITETNIKDNQLNLNQRKDFKLEEAIDNEMYESRESHKELEFEFNKNWVNYDMIRLTMRKSLVSKQ